MSNLLQFGHAVPLNINKLWICWQLVSCSALCRRRMELRGLYWLEFSGSDGGGRESENGEKRKWFKALDYSYDIIICVLTWYQHFMHHSYRSATVAGRQSLPILNRHVLNRLNRLLKMKLNYFFLILFIHNKLACQWCHRMSVENSVSAAVSYPVSSRTSLKSSLHLDGVFTSVSTVA